MRRLLGGLSTGLFFGLVLAAFTYAFVKPGPCSETDVCRVLPNGRCQPGPCELQNQHVLALVIIVLVCTLAGGLISVFRARRQAWSA